MTGKACVVGLGITGMSLVRHYRQRGWEVRVVDERATPPQLPSLREEFPAIGLTRLASYAELATFVAGCDEVAVSPGIAVRSLPAGLPLTGDLDLFGAALRAGRHGQQRPRVAAITGTNGKSTVTHLVAALAVAGGATAAAVGNIGVPLLDAYMDWQAHGWPAVVVAEVSSFQLATVKEPLGVDVAALLNIAPDHLDWHGTLADYAATKRKVYAGADCGVYDAADAQLAGFAADAGRQRAFNSAGVAPGAGWGVAGGQVCGPAAQAGLDCAQLTRAGIMPSAAAAALTVVAELLPDADGQAQLDCLARARGLEHRLQSLGEVAGIGFINDSKATNVAACCQALLSVPARCVPILGGDDKRQDFAPLAALIQDCDVPGVVLLDASPSLRAQLAGTGVGCEEAVDMEGAVALAHGMALAAGVPLVLLSPACASHGSYASFAARGDDFMRVVRELA